MTTVRGFHTPIIYSGDEGSDSGYSTPRVSNGTTKINDVVSANSSPMVRSTSNTIQGGISKLKLQLDTLDLNSTIERNNSFVNGRSNLNPRSQSSNGSSTPAASDDESDRTTYEVPIEHDFTSSDVQNEETPAGSLTIGVGPVQSYKPHKMTATDFEPLRCLGKGTYGTVLLVKQHSTGRLFAQKQLKKASLTVHRKLVEQTKTERAILESVNRHPFIVDLFYAFQDQEKLYLILEYAQGGELFTHLAQDRMFPEDTASFYMAEMVLALEYLHRTLGVIYRDLKPENCLLDSEGHLLLTDFGLSKVAVEGDECKSILGTVAYMAPEVVQGQKYGFAVDWWGLGAIGYDLLTGSPPFSANNDSKILEKIVKSKLAMPYFLSPDAKDLLTRLLRKEPHKRLGSNMPKDMLTIKKHRFFRKINWVLLAKRELTPPITPLITDPEMAENFDHTFTDLALSPVFASSRDPWSSTPSTANGLRVDDNPFGGFSYVASSSLINGGFWGRED